MKTTTAEKISQSLKKTTHSLLTKDERMGNYEEAGTFTSAFREDAKLQTCCSVTVHLKSRCLSSSQVLLVFGRKKKKNGTKFSASNSIVEESFSDPEKNLHKHNCLY